MLVGVVDMLLMNLAMLLLNALLLQILDLSIDFGDGVCGSRRRDQLRGNGRVRSCSGHVDELRLHGGIGVAHDHIGVGSSHLCVELFTAGLVHHAGATSGLEVVEVEGHRVAQVAHASHVQKLLELVIVGWRQGRILVPRCGVHHGDTDFPSR